MLSGHTFLPSFPSLNFWGLFLFVSVYITGSCRRLSFFFVTFCDFQNKEDNENSRLSNEYGKKKSTL